MGLKFNVLLHRLPTQKGILLPKHDLINQMMRPKDHFGGKFVLDFWVKQLSIHGSFLFVTFNVIFVLISCKFFHCLFILFLHKLTYRFWIKRWDFVFHFLFQFHCSVKVVLKEEKENSGKESHAYDSQPTNINGTFEMVGILDGNIRGIDWRDLFGKNY